jgi:hypothetical protein
MARLHDDIKKPPAPGRQAVIGKICDSIFAGPLPFAGIIRIRF